jgi:hypothetical protein
MYPLPYILNQYQRVYPIKRTLNQSFQRSNYDEMSEIRYTFHKESYHRVPREINTRSDHGGSL